MKYLKRILIVMLMSGIWEVHSVHAQEELMVDLSLIDGVEITPDNILSFQVFSNLNRTVNSKIKGSIIYRKSNIRLSYTFNMVIQPGLNRVDPHAIMPVFEYSSVSLKELFSIYKKLPQGVFEYCVIIDSGIPINESGSKEFSQCLFNKTEDLFFINLLDPENNAKIYEYNPNLSWTASFPFASELNYKLRVAEVKNGQTPVTAISRNNPVYEEKGLYMTSKLYPVYARPLIKDQKYVWTVDAYYKDLLLGGAEPWVFTIIEDSLITGIPSEPSYIDIREETGIYELFAPGKLKLKYELSNDRNDELKLILLDDKGNEVKLIKNFQKLKAESGDNRYILDFNEKQSLKHLRSYQLIIENKKKEVYKIIFKYVNPAFIK